MSLTDKENQIKKQLADSRELLAFEIMEFKKNINHRVDSVGNSWEALKENVGDKIYKMKNIARPLEEKIEQYPITTLVVSAAAGYALAKSSAKSRRNSVSNANNQARTPPSGYARSLITEHLLLPLAAQVVATFTHTLTNEIRRRVKDNKENISG